MATYRHWRPLLLLLLTLVWMGFIIFLSSHPNPASLSPTLGVVEQRSSPEVVAVLSHMAAFGVLALLLKSVTVFWWPGLFAHWGVFVFVIMFAITDEIHQGFTSGRVSSVGDVVLDGFGALIALVLWRVADVLMSRFSRRIGSI